MGSWYSEVTRRMFPPPPICSEYTSNSSSSVSFSMRNLNSSVLESAAAYTSIANRFFVCETTSEGCNGYQSNSTVRAVAVDNSTGVKATVHREWPALSVLISTPSGISRGTVGVSASVHWCWAVMVPDTGPFASPS